MRVHLDFTPAVAQGAGVGRYTRELARGLLRVADPNDRFVFGYAGPPAAPPFDLGPQAAVRRLGLPDRAWRLLLLASHARIVPPLDGVVGAADLYHGTNWAAPRLRRPTVVTVHDTTFVTHPECHTRLNRLYLTVAARLSVRRAIRVIADSAATARDAARHLGADPARVRTVPLGVEPRFRPVEPAAARSTVEAAFGLRGPYLLHVGTLEPRKNVAALVVAFNRLALRYPDLRLALAGGAGWHAGAALAAIDASPARDRIVRLGRVADDLLPALYTAAAAFAYPSLYEGFGLPPLEAMACGAPVVVPDVSSLPEVVGDAGLLYDPADPGALTAGIDRLVTDADLAAALRRLGVERAARFTWERTARETRAVYEEVLASPQPSPSGRRSREG